VVILFIAFNYLLYPQNTKNSHFHQIIHPISPNHTLISIRSVTVGIRAQRSQLGSNSDNKKSRTVLQITSLCESTLVRETCSRTSSTTNQIRQFQLYSWRADNGSLEQSEFSDFHLVAVQV
jgi:hypothetical protein